jgi:hypothetical protein
VRRREVNFLHYEIKAGPAEIIRVNINREANVRLLDPLNFAKYRLGKRCQPTAGPETYGPVQFVPPFKGVWHVVVDMEGRSGTVRASVDVLKG